MHNAIISLHECILRLCINNRSESITDRTKFDGTDNGLHKYSAGRDGNRPLRNPLRNVDLKDSACI